MIELQNKSNQHTIDCGMVKKKFVRNGTFRKAKVLKLNPKQIYLKPQRSPKQIILRNILKSKEKKNVQNSSVDPTNAGSKRLKKKPE